MRNLTRFLAMALTILMIAGCFSVAALAYADGPFANYDDEITVLSELGIFQGYQGTDNFGYGNNITRREACILFARVLTGRTDAAYAEANFKGETNNTPFTDLDAEGDFYGAISLAANKNLVIGFTEDGVTKFNPNGTISYQDFLTMCVRLCLDDAAAIAELDKGYPWSYINKAIALGLTNGVAGAPKNDVAITRGDAAMVAYNALFNTEIAGDILAVKYFGANVEKDTVVLTAAGNYNLTGVTLPEINGYVTVCPLNDDGTFDTTKTLFFPGSEVLGDEISNRDAWKYVGASFDIITLDGYKTLVKSEMNEKTVVTNPLEIASLTFGGNQYRLVSKYSSIVNTGDTWTGKNELILADLQNANRSNNRTPLTDANGNILGKAANGGEHTTILYVFKGTILGFPVYQSVATGAYVPYAEILADDNVEFVATGARQHAIITAADVTTRLYAIYDIETPKILTPKYAELVGYDDDGDGNVDRAFYADYAVGVLGTASEADYTDFAQFWDLYTMDLDFNGNGNIDTVYQITYGAHGPAFDLPTYSNNWSEETDGIAYNLDNRVGAKDGDVVLWYYNPVADAIVINKVYEKQTGVVSGYDFDKQTVTIMPTADSSDNWFENFGKGTTYSYAGIENLYGAESTALILGEQGVIAIREALNQQVEFIVDDGVIIGFWGNTPADDYYIFDKFINIDMNGYMNVRVMNADGLYEILTINTIDSKPYYLLDLDILSFWQGDVVRVVSEAATGRINLLTNNLDETTLTVYYEGKEDNCGTYYKALGMWWKDTTAALEVYESNGGTRGGQNRELPSRIIVEDDIMGLLVIDLDKAKDFAAISFNYDAPCYQIAEDVYYFTSDYDACHAEPAELGYWYLERDAEGNCKPATTEKLWATNGVSTGNVWDVVFFDGSIESSITATTNKYGVVYTYVDRATNSGGFLSLVKEQNEDVQYVVKSFNRTVDAGFYTLIKDVDGNIWFGNEIDPYDIAMELTMAEIQEIFPSADYTRKWMKTDGSFQNVTNTGSHWLNYFKLFDSSITSLDDIDLDATTITILNVHGTLDSIFFVDHGIADADNTLPKSNKPIVLFVDADIVKK